MLELNSTKQGPLTTISEALMCCRYLHVADAKMTGPGRRQIRTGESGCGDDAATPATEGDILVAS